MGFRVQPFGLETRSYFSVSNDSRRIPPALIQAYRRSSHLSQNFPFQFLVRASALCLSGLVFLWSSEADEIKKYQCKTPKVGILTITLTLQTQNLGPKTNRIPAFFVHAKPTAGLIARKRRSERLRTGFQHSKNQLRADGSFH